MTLPVANVSMIIEHQERDYLNLVKKYVDILDDDPSFLMIEELIATFEMAKNDIKWLIGDLLVFLRHRAAYSTVFKCVYDGQGEFPPELDRFVYKTFNQPLNQNLEPVQFLYWQVIRHKDFWLMYGNGEARVMAPIKNQPNLTDYQFEEQLITLEQRLRTLLPANTLLSYYRTSYVFTPDKRGGNSWTYYYEETNRLAAVKADVLTGVRGHERLQVMATYAEEILQDAEERLINTASRVRQETRAVKEEKLDYQFDIDVPERLFVYDKASGQRIVALEFIELDICRHILVACKHLTTYGIKPMSGRILWTHNDLFYNGRMIATIVNLNHPTVAAAIAELSQTMRWQVSLPKILQ